MRPARKYLYIFIVLPVLLLTGCGGNLPYFAQRVPLPAGPVCRVAIVPFLNNSEYPLADVIFQKVFSAQIQKSGDYHVIQEGDIHKIYQELHILPGEKPTQEQLQIVADRTDAQILITGTVLEMREDPARHDTNNPLIATDIQIINPRNGETFWTTYHSRDGNYYNKIMHFGSIHTVTGLSQQIAVEIINLWFKKGLNQCSVSPQS